MAQWRYVRNDGLRNRAYRIGGLFGVAGGVGGVEGLGLVGSAGSGDCAQLGSEASLTLRALFLGGGTAAPRAGLTWDK